MKISPSLLAADFAHLETELERVKTADMLHLDVMDGNFVPNISFGACVISAIRPHTGLFFDVHLMVERPERYLDDFIRAGADGITIHVESTDKVAESLEKIRKAGLRAALSVSPKTPIEQVFPYLPLCDMILIMTVEPGFGGQKLIKDTLQKARTLREKINAEGLRLDIEADGGIGLQNLDEVIDAGVNVVVAGSAIFGAEDPRAVIASMREKHSL